MNRTRARQAASRDPIPQAARPGAAQASSPDLDRARYRTDDRTSAQAGHLGHVRADPDLVRASTARTSGPPSTCEHGLHWRDEYQLTGRSLRPPGGQTPCWRHRRRCSYAVTYGPLLGIYIICPILCCPETGDTTILCHGIGAGQRFGCCRLHDQQVGSGRDAVVFVQARG